MKKSIIVTYQSGDQATLVAYPPDFAKWELATKKTISEFSGIYDILQKPSAREYQPTHSRVSDSDSHSYERMDIR